MGDGRGMEEEDEEEEEELQQWFHALDMQVVGACRSHERFKFNINESLLRMLATCFFIPLVSIRVGKIHKQPALLCPTTTRGNLNLTLLPTSDLHLFFAGDDGHTETLFTLTINSPTSPVKLEPISADTSGRSFFIKAPHAQTYYFWCSEKSKLLGIELLAKMKDFLNRRPSIGELTGISESQLECLATHLRAYLVVGGPTHAHQDSKSETPQLSHSSSKSQRSRANSSFQGSLSPRLSSFKEGPSRNLKNTASATATASAREKYRRRGDSIHLAVNNTTIASGSSEVAENNNNNNNNDKISSRPSSVVDSLAVPSESQVAFTCAPLLSPYYCWCPPGSSTLQFSSEPPKLPSSSIESLSLSLPPLSSLLPASSLLTQTPPFNLVDSPSLDFPAFLPDPLVRLPIPTPQHIPTFTPLICDPIVHIPVIDICSSGPGYLVSAGPTLATSIPPLRPNLVNPLIPETDSLVEKGARETLRLLISGSSQTNPTQMMDALPAVLTKTDENPSVIVEGLYTGTGDVDVLASSIAAIGLVSLSGRSNIRRCNRDNEEDGDSNDQNDKQ